MKNFNTLNNIVGWSVFLIATLVYFLTIEPTTSWWDCGEYIATAYKLQVGHPSLQEGYFRFLPLAT